LASFNERQLDCDDDVHNSRRVGEADLPAMWSHSDLSELATVGQKNCNKMGNDKRLKAHTPKFKNPETAV
jgi:hypothetical protein